VVRLQVCTIIGARPQFIKSCMVSRAMARSNQAGGVPITETLIHTGQHSDPDMSDVFFRELGLAEPAANLGLPGGEPASAVGAMLPAISAELESRRPDAVIVYGDTSSTLAGALAASYLGIPICHVEAGVRSFNQGMPEEINRVLTDRVARLHCCPTKTAIENLAAEGITKGVVQTGDVLRDLIDWARMVGKLSPAVPQPPSARSYAVLTVHRAENTASPDTLRRIMDYVRDMAGGGPVIWPMHPRVQLAIATFGLATKGFVVERPLGYFDMMRLVAGSAAVLTDSGGLQKEAYFLGVPCVTLRDETEWPETIECGWNRLWGTAGYQPRRPVTDLDRTGAATAVVAALRTMLGAPAHVA